MHSCFLTMFLLLFFFWRIVVLNEQIRSCNDVSDDGITIRYGQKNYCNSYIHLHHNYFLLLYCHFSYYLFRCSDQFPYPMDTTSVEPKYGNIIGIQRKWQSCDIMIATRSGDLSLIFTSQLHIISHFLCISSFISMFFTFDRSKANNKMEGHQRRKRNTQPSKK